MYPDPETFRSIGWMTSKYRVAEVLCELRDQVTMITMMTMTMMTMLTMMI